MLSFHLLDNAVYHLCLTFICHDLVLPFSETGELASTTVGLLEVLCPRLRLASDG